MLYGNWREQLKQLENMPMENRYIRYLITSTIKDMKADIPEASIIATLERMLAVIDDNIEVIDYYKPGSQWILGTKNSFWSESKV